VDFLGPVKKFDAYQQQHKSLAIPVAVIKKFGDDQAGSLAALVAYYAFFSLFPLLLVFVTVLGFVLQGDPSALDSVKHSVLGKFPVIGTSISNDKLQGDTLALIIGIVTSLLAGLGVTQAANAALDRVWAVPMKSRPNFIKARLRGVAVLAAIGAMFLVASAASGLVSGGLGGPLTKVAGILLSVLLNIGLFLVSFKLLCSAENSFRTLLPGAILAGVLWEILQVLGGIYIGHIKHSNNAYGTFALVLGVLAWLHLGAQITIYSAEINVVLKRRLWPRSLFGPPESPADEQTLTALAKVEERSDNQTVDVSFDDGRRPEASPPDEPIRWTNRISRRRGSGEP
jgi:YihY family inner membrane protein